MSTAARCPGGGGGNGFGRHGQQALTLGALAGELASAAPRFRLFPRLLFGGFLVMSAQLHFAEDALALHLLLQHLEGLVDIVVTDENLHAFASNGWVDFQCGHPLERRNRPRLGRPCSRTAPQCPPRRLRRDPPAEVQKRLCRPGLAVTASITTGRN